MPNLRQPRQRRSDTSTQPAVVEHDASENAELQDPEEFLDRNHPENDQYMKAVEHVQRQIMHATSMLRTKQVAILKSVFSGSNYTQAAKIHSTGAQTVSRLVNSTNGLRLLNLLQYHLKLLEGPNEAQRRSMLWRMAVKDELTDPKTAIKALEALNKMHFQNKQLETALDQNGAGTANAPTPIVINIDQRILPRGNLD